ncbi:MAG: Rpn family recombination-promoting nuclease/putative transposase, partial [Polyangiaceae bacterium]|nr:Rpn family recombination-promoting nuclease/putative transposase [Polyangiaceae bacterium]
MATRATRTTRTETTTLDPKNDFVFKCLFGRRGCRRRLLSLLNAILQPKTPITNVKILNPIIDKTRVTEKGVVFDIHVEFDDGSRLILEMEKSRKPAFRARMAFYWGKEYTDVLMSGDGYPKTRD